MTFCTSLSLSFIPLLTIQIQFIIFQRLVQIHKFEFRNITEFNGYKSVLMQYLLCYYLPLKMGYSVDASSIWKPEKLDKVINSVRY